ncbi:hydroxyisourate hydrolase [Marivita sp. GX14005]|uniref:hydroxyisourate hydrolase n=1 Tax=Marivita sp. GX14005 TaxID=2942276 RepID=UPI0020192382|nr:hydroxyisourate hydrolase [Marivita sp. GX14005]MCL3882655.1 hydroxyisourate hydrolase [Marivita sp. GX14005]
MTRLTATGLVALVTCASAASAEDISTHVLNIATGEGGGGVPVVLQMKEGDSWAEVGSASTQDNGRVEGFGITAEDATYRLVFDMTGYDAFEGDPFFPEITVTFDIQDTGRHHHVPVLVSPYGYSTYLGN